MSNDIWEARRKQLAEATRRAALAEFEHMGGAAAFIGRLDPKSDLLWIAAGTLEEIAVLVAGQIADH